jgi:hypothetical protein
VFVVARFHPFKSTAWSKMSNSGALDSSADRGGGDAGTPPLAGDAAGSGMGGRFLIPFVDGIWLGGRLLTLREW